MVIYIKFALFAFLQLHLCFQTDSDFCWVFEKLKKQSKFCSKKIKIWISRGGSGWILGKMSSQHGEAVTQAAQGVVESPSLAVFKKHIAEALRDMVYWWGWVDGWTRYSYRSFPTIMIL